MVALQRSSVVLRPDPSRVLCRVFIPGEEEPIRGRSRAQAVISRVLALSDQEAGDALESTVQLFAARHRDLVEHFDRHYDMVSTLTGGPDGMSLTRRRLIGAYLSQEYAFESTAYFNPSLVAHPDQSGVPDGSVRFVMSVRAVGEGHVSTLIFRSGILGPAGSVTVDPPCPYATTRSVRFSVMRSSQLQRAGLEAGLDAADLEFVLGMLPEKFMPEELIASVALLSLRPNGPTEPGRVLDTLSAIARGSYEVDFPVETELSERVLWPTADDERGGIEDARFVRFTEDDGSVTYRATYTGYGPTGIVSRLMETTDFRIFTSRRLSGRAVENKGVALFPRKIGGHYLALSRWDRESNSLALSDDGYHWDHVQSLHVASEPWELTHVGNCGSPIELEQGWLVTTHGAGPMRRYGIGALLLDREDPGRIIGVLPGPLLEPSDDERNGYVPNVVYSCGSILVNKTLVIPYGISDCRTSFATVDVDALVGAMLPPPSTAAASAQFSRGSRDISLKES